MELLLDPSSPSSMSFSRSPRDIACEQDIISRPLYVFLELCPTTCCSLLPRLLHLGAKVLPLQS